MVHALPHLSSSERSHEHQFPHQQLLRIELSQDAYVAGLTMSFLFVVVDGVLLNATDMYVP
jgi:hypothetical protein